ncbi:hypothetical protein B0T10DRAFT_565861 [Thelonectria olida]|uniref:Uncharacterized protein n=1 Tax=Thelonectria olida TaxID=1576542 RepID=A0A9P8VW27_9HYPO|nr:hypothetical protein B0T10DRAFT_565861 [Thelonectria olida]
MPRDVCASSPFDLLRGLESLPMAFHTTWQAGAKGNAQTTQMAENAKQPQRSASRLVRMRSFIREIPDRIRNRHVSPPRTPEPPSATLMVRTRDTAPTWSGPGGPPCAIDTLPLRPHNQSGFALAPIRSRPRSNAILPVTQGPEGQTYPSSPSPEQIAFATSPSSSHSPSEEMSSFPLLEETPPGVPQTAQLMTIRPVVLSQDSQSYYQRENDNGSIPNLGRQSVEQRRRARSRNVSLPRPERVTGTADSSNEVPGRGTPGNGSVPDRADSRPPHLPPLTGLSEAEDLQSHRRRATQGTVSPSIDEALEAADSGSWGGPRTSASGGAMPHPIRGGARAIHEGHSEDRNHPRTPASGGTARRPGRGGARAGYEGHSDDGAHPQNVPPRPAGPRPYPNEEFGENRYDTVPLPGRPDNGRYQRQHRISAQELHRTWGPPQGPRDGLDTPRRIRDILGHPDPLRSHPPNAGPGAPPSPPCPSDVPDFPQFLAAQTMPRLGGQEPRRNHNNRYNNLLRGRPLALLAPTFEVNEPEEGISSSENKPKGKRTSRNTKK